MNKKTIALFAVALLATASALTLADHIREPPPVDDPGTHAYVRNHPADTMERLESGETVEATYVAYNLNEHTDELDRFEHFTSRGRMADNELFHHIGLPDGTFQNRSLWQVQNYTRGAVVASGPGACFGVLNGVNAGLGVIAKGDQEVDFHAPGPFEREKVDDSRAEIRVDGHTYVINVTDGEVEVNGTHIEVDLEDGGQARGWIADEFDGTTEVLHYELDHIFASEECGVSQEADQEPQEEPDEGNETEGASDVGVEKTGSFDNESKTASFDVTVDSHGNEDATNVTLSDELPEADGGDGNDSSWNVSGPDADACEQSGEDGRNVTCDFGTLSPDETRTVEFSADHSGCSSLDNTAEVSADEDTHPQDNEDNASIPARDCPEEEPEDEEEEAEAAPDVGVNKTGDWSDGWAIFDIVVDSHGNENATNVTLSDSLPEADGGDTDDTQWYLGGSDADACEQSGEDGRELACDFGELSPNETRTIDVRAYNSECNALNNTAEVSADNDSHPEDDSDSAVAVGDCPDEEAEEDDVEEDEEVEEEEEVDHAVCPRTIGFWKNHPSEWPVDELTLGDQTYDKSELMDIVSASGEDASLKMSRQLVAAKLNIEAGSDPAPVNGTIEDADALLAEYDGKLPYDVEPSSEDGQRFVSLSEDLDAYNNGQDSEDCPDDEDDAETAGASAATLPTVGASALIGAILAVAVAKARLRD